MTMVAPNRLTARSARAGAWGERKTTMTTKRIIAGALVSGGVALGGLGLAAPAQASPSY
jgi:hypothetical protein